MSVVLSDAEAAARRRFAQRFGPQIVHLRRLGLSKGQIAAQLHINAAVVAEILTAAGLPAETTALAHAAAEHDEQALRLRRAKAKRTKALRAIAEADRVLKALG